MFPFQVIVITLAFASSINGGVVSPHHSRSNGDQYREGAGRGEDPQVKAAHFSSREATDKGPLSPKDTQGFANDGMQKLQGNNLDAITKYKMVNKSTEVLEAATTRDKRSYYPYGTITYRVPQFQSISAWRPSLYPLQRPYYIPIYGIDGRIPIYFPPQPFYYNPGTPPHNPVKPPYVGPTYLPPVTPSPHQNGTTMMPTDNRFNDNDDDDRPVWDNVNDEDRDSQPARPSIVPTRKPPQASPTFPPLVHKDGSTDSNTGNNFSINNNEVPTSTPSPAPTLPGPSRCVWAIISCCSTSSKDISYNCFDQLGCSGPFWDVSPCESDYAKAAIESALNYYNSRT